MHKIPRTSKCVHNRTQSIERSSTGANEMEFLRYRAARAKFGPNMTPTSLPNYAQSGTKVFQELKVNTFCDLKSTSNNAMVGEHPGEPKWSQK